MKRLDPLRSKKTFIRKKLGHAVIYNKILNSGYGQLSKVAFYWLFTIYEIIDILVIRYDDAMTKVNYGN